MDFKFSLNSVFNSIFTYICTPTMLPILLTNFRYPQKMFICLFFSHVRLFAPFISEVYSFVLPYLLNAKCQWSSGSRSGASIQCKTPRAPALQNRHY